MKKQLLRKGIFSTLFMLFSFGLMAQSTHIDGNITDNNGDPLVGANILVKGKVIGTVADIDGNYSLDVKSAPPLTLIISMVGFASQEVEITEANTKGMDFKLEEQMLLGQEVVVSASRVEESILESPVTVEKMGITAIKNTASATYYDGIANLKGVQMTASSMTFKSINTRGFATMANTRFVQLIDGMDNSAPGLNFPMGNMVGIGELDIESVELVPGAASALYGPNAFNGILLMNSKNPFDYQGLSVSAKAGVTQQEAAGTNGYYDFNLRYAKAFNNKFAFKVNFSYLTAQDWWAADYSQHAEEDPGQFNTNYNGINIYGDAIATTLNFDALAGAPPETFGAEKIARTGYKEVDLIDYDTESIKGSVGLNYRLTDKMELSYDYRFGKGTAIYQGFSRYSLNNLSLQQHRIELRGDNFFVRAYGSFENAGDSYDSRFAAWNINRAWKSDAQWFGEYAGAYIGGVLGGLDRQAAHDGARAFADTGRLIPGTPEFEAEKKRITELADLATGSKFLDESKMYHAEGSFNFKNQISFIDLVVGAHFRQYNLNSFGTIFNDKPIEDGGNGPISISEYGAYAQASKRIINDRLKLGASVRYDKNENFDGQFSPRAFAVMALDPDRKHNFRASYQTGFRNPDTQSQFIALDLGPATLVGGTQKNLDMYSKTTNFGVISGSTLYDNAYTASSAAAFGAAFPGYVTDEFILLVGAGADPNDPNTLAQAQGLAVAKNADQLIVAENNLVKPEQVTSIEFGYKGVFANKLMIDINYYSSKYKDFGLINTIVAIPDAAGDVNDLTTFSGAAAFLGMGATGETEAYQLYTNIADDVSSSGFGLGLNYLLPGGYDLGGSYNYATFSLDAQSNPDNIPGFNTPKNRYNIQFSNREVFDNFGFSASYRWSDKYDWTGTFGNGPVEAFSSLDLQVSYNLTGMRSVVKLGANNVIGTEFVQAYGAPAIGSTYYLSLTFDEMFR